MTNLEGLKMQLQYAMEKYGEDAFVTRELERQIEEIEQSKPSGQSPQLLQFAAGFRKGRKKQRTT